MNNLKPGRNNFSIYVGEEHRDFWAIFEIFCKNRGIPLSTMVIRAMLFFVAHLPKHLAEQWKRATNIYYEQEKIKTQAMAAYNVTSYIEPTSGGNNG